MKKSDGKKAIASAMSAKKTAAKPKKVQEPAKKPAKKKKVAAPTLSYADRSSKLKPPEGYAPIVEQVVSSWADHKQLIRIEGRSPVRLASIFERAKKARTAEDALRKRYEKALHKLVDARLLVEEEMWSQSLDVYRVAKAMTPIRPELEKAFDKMTEHFSRPGRSQVPPAAPLPQVAVLRDADPEDA